jgi:hypothetical protein
VAALEKSDERPPLGVAEVVDHLVRIVGVGEGDPCSTSPNSASLTRNS